MSRICRNRFLHILTFDCFTTMQSESHVSNLSSTALGMVEDSSTGSHQVVGHSPSASGVVGDGSTGHRNIAVLPVNQIHIDGFLKGCFCCDGDRPMIMDHSHLVRSADIASTSAYADECTFEEHLHSTYEGLIFPHFFFFESSLTIFISANSSVHTNDPDTLSLIRLEPWTQVLYDCPPLYPCTPIQ